MKNAFTKTFFSAVQKHLTKRVIRLWLGFATCQKRSANTAFISCIRGILFQDVKIAQRHIIAFYIETNLDIKNNLYGYMHMSILYSRFHQNI